ncbi:hypothetical protein [Plesiocystis pacifica]|nr:hypothetical protein [Plesiocystis pacifica]
MAAIYEDSDCTLFAGFVMARLDMRLYDELHEVWGGTSAPPLAQRLVIALNLAAVVAEVHSASHRIGDLRERNILVNRSCEVVLVDCDSFEIWTHSGEVFYSGMGIGDYLPPELLHWLDGGHSLETVERYWSDLYALAVLIFQLLMDGVRPYSATGPGITPELATYPPKVTSCTYPYVDTGGRFAPPTYAPDIALIPPPVQQLFACAFVTGHSHPELRPTAAQWRDCLAEVVGQLRLCSQNPVHRYPAHLSACPLCAESPSGPSSAIQSFPPEPTQPSSGTTEHSDRVLAVIFAAMAAIAAIIYACSTML